MVAPARAGQNPAYRPAPHLPDSVIRVAPSPRTKLILLALIPPILLLGLWLLRPRIAAEETSGVVAATGAMPELEGQAVVGSGAVTPDAYRGKVVLVNFWAEWCGPCRTEQPVLQDLWEEYRDRGVQFLGVNHNDQRAAAQTFVEEFDVTYPSVFDPAGRWAGEFAIPFVPSTIIAGPDGQLRYQLFGEKDEPTFRRYLDEVLAEA